MWHYQEEIIFYLNNKHLLDGFLIHLRSCFSFSIKSVTRTDLSHWLPLPASVCRFSRRVINTTFSFWWTHTADRRILFTKTTADWAALGLLMWLIDWHIFTGSYSLIYHGRLKLKALYLHSILPSVFFSPLSTLRKNLGCISFFKITAVQWLGKKKVQ